jgi:protein required for attachment to host cells
MTQSTWILVCDASRARLLREEPRGKRFSLLQELDHEESRARARDLMADAHGRKPVGPVPARSVQGQGGAFGRPGAEPDTDPKEVEAHKFARELAAVLERGLYDHAYDRLVVVAPPHFLGMIRGTLTTEVAKHVDVTIDKDLTWLELPALTERLEDALPRA